MPESNVKIAFDEPVNKEIAQISRPSLETSLFTVSPSSTFHHQTDAFSFFFCGERYCSWQDDSASHCHFYRGQLRKEAIRETVDGDKGSAGEKCWVKRRGGGHMSLVQTFSFCPSSVVM